MRVCVLCATIHCCAITHLIRRIGCGGKHGPLHPYHLLLPPTPPSVSLFFPASPLSCHLRPLSPSLPQYQYSPSPSPSHGLLLDSRAKARHRKVNKYLFLSTPPPLPSSHLPPLNHRDIKAFCSKRSFIQDQLRRAKGGTAPTGPLKPRAIQAELAHYQVSRVSMPIPTLRTTGISYSFHSSFMHNLGPLQEAQV